MFLVLCQDPTPDPDLGSEKELLFPLRSKERGAGQARVAVVQSPRSTAREKERERGSMMGATITHEVQCMDIVNTKNKISSP